MRRLLLLPHREFLGPEGVKKALLLLPLGRFRAIATTTTNAMLIILLPFYFLLGSYWSAWVRNYSSTRMTYQYSFYSLIGSFMRVIFYANSPHGLLLPLRESRD